MCEDAKMPSKSLDKTCLSNASVLLSDPKQGKVGDGANSIIFV
jgi:hypothetical protein